MIYRRHNLIRGKNDALGQLQVALSKILSSIGGSFRLNRIINRDFRVDSTVSTGAQVIDAVLKVFLVGEVTGEGFDQAASLEKTVGIDVIGGYEVSEHVVLAL